MPRKLYSLGAFLVLVAGTASAQHYATILGKVTDSSGAVVPGAQVTANNTETGLERSTVTTSTGDYELPALPITGSWGITVSRTGFQQQQINGIVLEVDQKARFDVVMKPGAVTEKVTVNEQAPLVTTDSGAIGEVIENRSVLDLPLNGRNFVSLVALTPGVSNDTRGNSPQTGFPRVNVGGGHSAKTEVLLDGISDQDQLFDGVMFQPSIDALQEFKVEANSFDAEYGRGDAVINATVKGGTNEYHGDLFEFLRNSDLDSRNFFSPKVAKLEQNQFGGTLGGPILHNRTFFFASYDGTRLSQGVPENNIAATTAMQSGNFAGTGYTVKDPLTGVPFPGDQIPASRIDPSSAYFLKFLPPPNTAQGTFFYNGANTSSPNQGNIRIDHRFSDMDTLFGRYSINDLSQSSPGALPTLGGTRLSIRVQDAVLSETHSFSPTMVNEFRLGYERMYAVSLPQVQGTNYTELAGIQGFNETTANFPGFPTINISDGSALGINGNDFVPLVNPENMYEIVDGLTWNKGAHTLKFGIDLRQNVFTSTNAAHSRGNFTFSGLYTGNGFADFLTGYPTTALRDFPRNLFGQTNDNYHFFVKDDWKVSSRLTLNLGLRYEFNPQPSMLQDQIAWFDPNTGQIAVSQYHGAPNLVTQQVAQFVYPQYTQYFVTPQSVGLPNSLYFNHHRDFSPRLGLAFRPFNDNKTVIRAGYGRFYLLESGNNTVSSAIVNLPFIVDETKSQPTVHGLPTLQFQNFFQPFSTNEKFNTPYITTFNPNDNEPVVDEWNFTVQREFWSNMVAEVAYVGSKGTHLEMNSTPFNVPPPLTPGDTLSYQQRLPFPAFSTGTYLENASNSTYEALQAKLEKRLSRGLTFLVSYAFGKALDGMTSDAGGDAVDNPFNLRTMKGPSSFDATNRLTASYVYDLPVGRGRSFLKGSSRLVDAAIGGWRAAGIVSYRSGLPFTPSLGGADPAGVSGAYARRPNVVPGVDASLANPTITQWFNPAAFAVPAQYTIGNAGRDILRGPNLAETDFSLSKEFHATESKYLEFRSEFFNILNHPFFGLPNTNIQSPNAGKITSTSNNSGPATSRIIQFGLKLYF